MLTEPCQICPKEPHQICPRNHARSPPQFHTEPLPMTSSKHVQTLTITIKVDGPRDKSSSREWLVSSPVNSRQSVINERTGDGKDSVNQRHHQDTNFSRLFLQLLSPAGRPATTFCFKKTTLKSQIFPISNHNQSHRHIHAHITPDYTSHIFFYDFRSFFYYYIFMFIIVIHISK